VRLATSVVRSVEPSVDYEDLDLRVDGDGQHDPAELPKLLVPLEENQADIVVGSRFTGARSYRARSSGGWGSRLRQDDSLIARQRVTDTTSGFRA